MRDHEIDNIDCIARTIVLSIFSMFVVYVLWVLGGCVHREVKILEASQEYRLKKIQEQL